MTKRTRVKICGITRVEDALFAVEQGADALGFVFYEKSPRYITPNDAAAICRQLPVFVERVGLFVNAQANDISACARQVGLSLLQFHGDECEAFCASFDLPYMKAVRVKNQADIVQGFTDYDSSSCILLDTFVEGIEGGTGKSFDWRLIPNKYASDVVLAGGLNPRNVGEAIAQVRPYAVDVSGGVETALGAKSEAKIKSFITAVNDADLIK